MSYVLVFCVCVCLSGVADLKNCVTGSREEKIEGMGGKGRGMREKNCFL